MSRESNVSWILFWLLVEYVDLCDVWEAHNHKAADKLFSSLSEEKEEHLLIQTDIMLPFMEKCERAGFKYAGFLSIIPPAFETNKGQRQEILDDLENFINEKYPT